MSGKAIDIVKRKKRQPETFNRAKLHSSVRAACLSVRSHEGSADQAANNVCDAVLVWLEERPRVTSEDLRRIAGKNLQKYHPDAAYMYEHQRNIM